LSKKFFQVSTMKKPELLAPAGNMEKLRIAVHYGADAVYLGGKNFGLRNLADNFTPAEMAEGGGRPTEGGPPRPTFADNQDIEPLYRYFDQVAYPFDAHRRRSGVTDISRGLPGRHHLCRPYHQLEGALFAAAEPEDQLAEISQAASG
jgi:putative protease